MANFTVNTGKLDSAADEIKNAGSKINEIMNKADETMDIAKNSFLGKLADSIQDAILLTGMKINIKDMNKLSDALKEISEIYKKYENRVEQYSYKDPNVLQYLNEGGEGYMEYNYYSEFSSKRSLYGDAFLVIGNNLTDLSYWTGSYDEKIIYNSLASILASMTGTEGPDLWGIELGKDVLDSITDGEDFVDKITKGELFPEFADELEILKGISKGLDWGKLAVEDIFYLLTDFSKNLAYIKTLESALEDTGENSQEIKTALSKLELDYANQYIKVFDDVVEEVAQGGFDSVLSTASGGVLSVVEFASGVVYTATGWDEDAENLEMLTGIENYKHNLNRAYNEKADIIKSGNYTEEDLEEFERLHNLSKATTVKEYELMADLTDDKEDKEYIQNELDEIRNTPSF